MFSLVERMTCSHPWDRATAAFSSDPTVPITVAPSAFSHWQAMSPTPPAAAWNRTVSPALTGYVRRIRYCAVIPLSITAAAIWSAIPSGIGTRIAAGSTRASAYDPGGPPAYATRSPARTTVTPGPTASTTPAASLPKPLGRGIG